MHGQKRSEYKSRLLDPETSSRLATKAQQWNNLSHELLSQRRNLFSSSEPDVTTTDSTHSPSPTALVKVTEKMLTVNPDPSHLWNIRREMILYLIHNSSTPFDLEPELKLTAHCLQRNPKSYSTWFHRKWSISYRLSHGYPLKSDKEEVKQEPASQELLHTEKHSTVENTILQTELDLCCQFLLMDERNFHCWNYRRFVVALMGFSFDGNHNFNSRDCDNTNNDNSVALNGSETGSFDGAWSSWLNVLIDNDRDLLCSSGTTSVLMGAQLTPSSLQISALEPLTTCLIDERRTFNNFIHPLIPLPKTELRKLILNEWDFTTLKIQDNFSNGSAFHYRSKLLPLILEGRLQPDSGPMERQRAIMSISRDEWENVLLDAVFTEPDDQTPWWYHRFIVTWAKPSANLRGHVSMDEAKELARNYELLLSDMSDSLKELLEVEKENSMSANDDADRTEDKGVKCKWVYLGLHLVLSSLLKSKSDNPNSDGDESRELLDEAMKCLEELKTIDPCRSARYEILVREVYDRPQNS